MKIKIDTNKLAIYGLGADEYIYLYCYMQGVKPPDVVLKKINTVTLVDNKFIRIVPTGFIPLKKAQSLMSVVLKSQGVEQWINDWRNIWPEGVKTAGHYVRGDRADCVKKMTKFLEETEYDKDDVYAAARNYIQEKQKEGFKYTMTANNFIKKNDTSALATQCELGGKATEREDKYGGFHKNI